MAFEIATPGNDATIGRTVEGAPFLGDDNYLYIYPEYTRELLSWVYSTPETVAAAQVAANDAQEANTAAQAAAAAAAAAVTAAFSTVTTYTPTIAGWNGGGSVTGRYVRVGRLVSGFLDVRGGSYTANAIFPLPVAGDAVLWSAPSAYGHMWKAGNRYPLTFASIGGNSRDLAAYLSASGLVAGIRIGSNAGTFGVDDLIRMNFSYLSLT